MQVRDARGGEWVLGRPVGSGGFGDIYLCNQGPEECPEDARYEYLVGSFHVKGLTIDAANLVRMVRMDIPLT